MKKARIIRGNLLALAVGVWIFGLGGARPAPAQVTSFQIQVPEKIAPGQLPISRMKAIVRVASDVGVAFRITPPVGGDERIPPAGTIASGTTTAEVEFGDDVVWIVRPASAPGDPLARTYEIWFDLLSDFDANDNCSNLLAGPIETWTVEIDAGPGITAVCPLSFDPNVPGNECTSGVGGSLNSPRLVPSGEPVAQVVGSTTGGNLCAEARPAVDVALVLDKSGSMGGSTLGGAPRPKIEALQAAVTDFVGAWDDLRTSEGGTAPADRIGLIFFDSNSHWMDDAGVAGWAGIPDGLDDFDDLRDEITNHIGDLNPGGSTSIGDGLTSAAGAFDFGNGHRKVILLMSNGHENTDLRVKVDDPVSPSEVQTYLAPDPDDTTPLPNQDQYRVYAVTVGASPAVSADINEDVALATGGFYINSEDDADLLRPFFLELLQNFVKFNTYETARLISGRSRSNAPFSVNFPVTATTRSLAINVLWNPALGALRATAIPPGGGNPITQTGTGSIRMSPTLPLPPPQGEWTLQVAFVDQSVPEVPLDLVVLADDVAIRSDLTIVPADYAPGDRIRLQARVTQAGRPLLGLGSNPGDQMVARLIKPAVGIGDLLSESSAGTTQPAPADPATLAGAKLSNELQANPDALRRDEDTIALTDDGDPDHGDQTAGDGIYSGLYEARLPGHHQFLFGIEGTTGGDNRFSRQQIKTVHVRSVPDAGETGIQTSVITTSDGGRLVISMTPRTRFRNRLGPGFANYFWFTAPQVRPFKPVDNLDGTYTATLSFSGTTPPDVTGHFVRTSTNIDDSVLPENLPVPLGDDTRFIDSVGGGTSSRRWSLSLHAGINDPQGAAPSFLNGDTSYGVDLEYRFRRIWALELFYGRDRFDVAGLFDFDVDHLSLNAKAYFGSSVLQPFVLAGVGLYDASPGDQESGFNAGAGVQYSLTPRLAVEADGRYHWIDTSPDRFEFLTWHGVLRIRF